MQKIPNGVSHHHDVFFTLEHEFEDETGHDEVDLGGSGTA